MSDVLDPKIVNEILRQRPDLTYKDIERMVSKKMIELNMSPKTALYLVTLELGVRLDSKVADYLEIGKLRGGLNRVRVIGRILWLKNEEYFDSPTFGKRPYVRGGIGDKTGVVNIIFWGYTRDKLEELGIIPGAVVDISGASTKTSIIGDVEIHVSENAQIKIDIEKDSSYPSIRDYVVRLDECELSESRVNVYGRVITSISVRRYKAADREGTLANFLLAAGECAIKVVLWNTAVDEYSWIKPGDNIMIFNGRVKTGMRGEREIHIGRSSHVEYLPGVKIDIIYKESSLIEVENGYNLKSLDLRIGAKGKERVSMKTGNRSLGLYVIDDTADATLVLIGEEAVLRGKEANVGDIIRISGFRGAKRTDQIFVFCDEASTIIINPSSSKSIPPIDVKTKKARDLSIADRVVSVEGRVVREPSLIPHTAPMTQDQYEFVIEDTNGDPINISYRGDLSLYTDEYIRVGDYIRVEAGFLDASSLIGPMSVPTIRLRAYSRIFKI